METTLLKIRELVDANTIVGQPITTADGTVLVPVSEVSVGFGCGGSDFQTRSGPGNNFGGGGGAGVKIYPVAFLAIRDGNVRVINLGAPPANTVDRIVDAAPEVIDKVSALINKNKTDKEYSSFEEE